MRGIRVRVIASTIVPLFVVLMATPAAAGPYETVRVTLASGPSPFAGCDISGMFLSETEVNYVDTELEPFVAVNPADPANIIGVYQQDRWSGGGARGLVAAVSHDGGQTWAHTWAPFSVCSGGTPENGGDYERASDPWVSFSPDGVAYQISLSINFVEDPRSAILVSRSTDGGDTWSDPVTVVDTPSDEAPFLFHDKESLTADPFDSNFVYAVWDRSRFPSDQAAFNAQHAFSFRGDIMFSRTTNGGASWEPARAIFQPRSNRFAIGSIIDVLPDGTLVDLVDIGQGSGVQGSGQFDISVLLSHDRGATWSDPIKIEDEDAFDVVDPDTGANVRAGEGLPDIAVDRNPGSAGFGNVYAVWSTRLLGPHPKKRQNSDIAFSMSTDGGLTWSPITRANQGPAGVQSFTPVVDVASDGTVGVTYYDFRNNTADPGVPTDYWLAHCHPETDCSDAGNWEENHVAGPFDIERAPVARGYFVGDYEGLTSVGTTFLPFFSQTTATDRANAYLGVVSPAP